MDGRGACWWFLRQLYSGHLIQNDFITFRCIHNERPSHHPQTGQPQYTTKTLLQRNVPVTELRENFIKAGGLFDQLTLLNQNAVQPANVYYGVNPRNHPTDSKKANIRCMIDFHLDIDVNSQYSLEDRQQQLAFWAAMGYEPTMTVFSGHGFQPHWVSQLSVPCDVGEPVLKKIVKLAGCTEGGNTWDCTRILRAPGFKNVKNWHNDDTPEATIVWPTEAAIEASIETKSIRPRYTLEHMQNFPLSTKTAIQEFTDQARAMDGDYRENLQRIVQAYRDRQVSNEVQQVAQNIATSQAGATAHIDSQIEIQFVPQKKVIPPDIKDIPWHAQSRKWIITFCTKGYHGLTEADKEFIKEKAKHHFHNNPNEKQADLDASSLEAKIIYALISMGYVEEAVTEFWNRPDIKLYRDYKFQRSPNYLSTTYASMLNAVRGAKSANLNSRENIAARTEAGFGPGCIYVGPDGATYIGTSMLPRKVLSVEMKLVQVLEHVDARGAEYWKIRVTAKNPDGTLAQALRMIPRDAFNNVNNLRKYCLGRLFCTTDRNSDLQELADKMYNERENLNIAKFHTSMVYDKTNNQFVFPSLLIGHDEFIQLEKFDDQEIQSKFPWHECFVTEAASKEKVQQTLRRHWNNLIHIHLPRLPCAVIGSIAANAERAIIHAKKLADDISMPCVSVRGRGSSGKTETGKILFKLCGMENPKKAFQSLLSSNFALGRMAELVKFIPIPIDEFKEQDHNKKRIAEVRQLIKSTYTGEVVAKGRQDLSLNASSINSQYIVFGENALEKPNDIAEATRIFGVDTDEFTPPTNNTIWSELNAAPLAEIGPHFYQWILNNNHEEWYRKLLTLRHEIINKLENDFGIEKTRAGNNLATLIWGCHLFDAFVTEMCPELDTLSKAFNLDEVFIDYFKEQAQENETKVSINIGGTKQLIAKDETLAFIEAIADMHNESFREYKNALENNVFVFMEDDLTVKIHLKNAYNLYKLRAISMHENIPEHITIHSRIRGSLTRKEKWIIGKNRPITYRGTTIRVLVLNKLALKQMGIWNLQTANSEPHVLATTTDNENQFNEFRPGV